MFVNRFKQIGGLFIFLVFSLILVPVLAAMFVVVKMSRFFPNFNKAIRISFEEIKKISNEKQMTSIEDMHELREKIESNENITQFSRIFLYVTGFFFIILLIFSIMFTLFALVSSNTLDSMSEHIRPLDDLLADKEYRLSTSEKNTHLQIHFQFALPIARCILSHYINGFIKQLKILR